MQMPAELRESNVAAAGCDAISLNARVGQPERVAERGKKLGRQSLLSEGLLFEFCEVCRRIAAEAGAQDPGLVALFQAGSGFAPFDKIDRGEVLGAERSDAGQRGGEDADGTTHDQTG